MEAASPNASFGASSTLKVSRTPEALTYLRFSGAELPVAGTVTSARLRLFAMSNAAQGAVVHDSPGVHLWDESVTWNTRHHASLRVDAEPRAEAFLRFDVQLRSERIQRVALRLYAIDGTGNGPRLYRASTFDGATTDWNHRPAPVGEPLVDLGAVARDAWVELDVTNTVTASGTYAFALLPDSTNSVGFVSTDAEARHIIGGAPRLVVTYESDPFCSYRGTKPSGTTAWVRQDGGAQAEAPVTWRPRRMAGSRSSPGSSARGPRPSRRVTPSPCTGRMAPSRGRAPSRRRGCGWRRWW
ncbi:DNRLRE domain-containing protein [Corallococcus sp. CA049B]|uniref:CBM96 family carbohydrate-binding protein n=1 Tax=Corallococcus sp. CA049B TaxID=2316730 RepID=UPI000EA1E314|nr:DNRLRE domain-containing protein [Corallococcus sp. CA049B]RKG76169.1 DNRLRE domain-containing protein [Corallococcus sp. CA049B]